MAKRPPNPHTSYGRKRISNEARAYNKTLTPKEREDANLLGFIMIGGLLVVILIFLFAIGGTDAILDWIKPKGIK
jgi:uncharacterized integral membrane protein